MDTAKRSAHAGTRLCLREEARDTPRQGQAAMGANAEDEPTAYALRGPSPTSLTAFLFTDLRNSTALYERMGDASAYDIVRRHFAFLSDLILDHNGTVVKTIGDAMMAAFDDPFDAVAVALIAQARIGYFNRTMADRSRQRRVTVRLGVHAGGCVKVELGDRIDYFGSTVNLAARLRGKSRNGDVVLSHAVAGCPGVRQLLATLPMREEILPLRGYTNPVRFVRVLPLVRPVVGTMSAPAIPLASSETPPGAFFALGGH